MLRHPSKLKHTLLYIVPSTTKKEEVPGKPPHILEAAYSTPEMLPLPAYWDT